ncbi:hypothetical protein PILCRDRAFT_816200 [Piloderma croceum F 1598]|uniref:Uncharacterized protein n=1 Tax=Piloderma croceum (strain F 1598) TaxID=765440 RepID=A0A0C3G6G3_PILCF|nr:hypothetical protein PILCRDRAFT_816200 [Piloderma croceum F 1598]
MAPLWTGRLKVMLVLKTSGSFGNRFIYSSRLAVNLADPGARDLRRFIAFEYERD